MIEAVTTTPSRRPLLSPSVSESAVALRWLARLRWGAVLGQLLAIAVASELTDVALALVPLLSLVALAALSNAGLVWLLGRGVAGSRVVVGVLVLDVLLLTGLLIAAGGSSNPFSIFYFVHVALAGLLLGARGAWFMALFTDLLFGLLFFVPSAPLEEHGMHMQGSSLHLQGMWVAFALGAAFVATFVSGLAKALSGREAELARMRSRIELEIAGLRDSCGQAAYWHGLAELHPGTAAIAARWSRTLAVTPENLMHAVRAHLDRKSVQLTAVGDLEPVWRAALRHRVRSDSPPRASALR